MHRYPRDSNRRFAEKTGGGDSKTVDRVKSSPNCELLLSCGVSWFWLVMCLFVMLKSGELFSVLLQVSPPDKMSLLLHNPYDEVGGGGDGDTFNSSIFLSCVSLSLLPSPPSFFLFPATCRSALGYITSQVMS